MQVLTLNVTTVPWSVNLLTFLMSLISLLVMYIVTLFYIQASYEVFLVKP